MHVVMINIPFTENALIDVPFHKKPDHNLCRIDTMNILEDAHGQQNIYHMYDQLLLFILFVVVACEYKMINNNENNIPNSHLISCSLCLISAIINYFALSIIAIYMYI